MTDCTPSRRRSSAKALAWAAGLQVVANGNYSAVPAGIDPATPYGPPVARTDWVISKEGVLLASVVAVGPFLETFKEFPPSQRPATFTIDQAMEKLKQGLGGN